jgi:hypothetical protein
MRRMLRFQLTCQLSEQRRADLVIDTRGAPLHLQGSRLGAFASEALLAPLSKPCVTQVPEITDFAL